MLGYSPYYHGTIRKCIGAFGRIFNDINIQREDADGQKIQAIKVPLAYAAKEKWLQRVEQDTDIDGQAVGHTLPRISFEMTNLSYDGSRKVQSLSRILKYTTGESESLSRVYAPVPYNIEISLYAIAKTQEDALRIVEQILPFFTPQYNIPMKVLPDYNNLIIDTPVILNSVSMQDDYEGDMMTRRQIIYTLTFTMKSYLFGPVGTASVITNVQANLKDANNPTAFGYAAYEANATPNDLTADPADYTVIEGWDETP
jgi:hypothetical protein